MFVYSTIHTLPPMQMRRLRTVVILSILTACSNQPPTSDNMAKTDSLRLTTETISKPITIITGNDLVDRINEIKNLPYRTLKFNGTEIDSISWTCGDSLYWEIVGLGKEAIPYLIKKIQDNSKTDIKIPCRESKLTVGTTAFMALDDIISIPYFLVFEIQWDVLEMNCDFGYPVGLLEYINEHPQEAYNKIIKWYDRYGQSIEKKALKRADQTDCQKKYGIKYELTIKY